MDIDMRNGYNDYLVSIRERNMDTAVNNIIDQFTNHSMINHPIEQITPCATVGIPVVEGHFFQKCNPGNKRVRGYPVEDMSFLAPPGIPMCEEIIVGTPILWAA